MLRHLSIRNFALIESVDVEFQSGLNIITGETGAGKSILIDAFSLILGGRASSDEVRKGAEKAVVEGVFYVKGHRAVKDLIFTNELEEAEDLILRRELSAKGTSRCFVNDTPVSLAVLKSFGDALVDLHGQHDHQSLLRRETHRELLDDYGRLDGLVSEYRDGHAELVRLAAALRELRSLEARLMRERDLYEFQIKEIDEVGPLAGEEEDLSGELRILENAEKLYDATLRLHQNLYEGDQAVHDLLVTARNQLEDLSEIDPAFNGPRDECSAAAVIVDELTKFIQHYNSRIEFNPERLEYIRERLGRLALLKKKYGGSLEAVIAHRESIGAAYATASNFDAEVRSLEELLEKSRGSASAAAQRLSAKRRELTAKVSRGVLVELSTLGIPSGKFEVQIEPLAAPADGDPIFLRLGKERIAAGPHGMDDIEFLLSTNPGEDLKPLAKVASGGEVSRVMLALKTILAKSERLPLLVFDEIDVGISGRIAQAVGKSLRSLAQYHQIIAITHLPQIAGLADLHLSVEKKERKGRTTTTLRALELEERVKEVARLLSGESVTRSGLDSARELMGLER
ncbi:MAG: DNA repair protein RecN [Bacteroidetes bacterium]|jgi:DNA repair protein RecN (Recombination protein N)|nr:DNA repair protein RecN [Bacteroidota bacterium]